jgi:ABC-type multidrug transport system ATPase subunit
MSPGGPAVSIRFEELGLQLKDGRTVLDGVTGDFKAGAMCAIMGPSGCGKTTFMNTLCGRATYGVRTGKVWFRDVEVNPAEMRPSFGFVPQDDIVHARLTVRENLHFAAQLRNPSSTPAAVIDDIVNDALTVLQISHIQSSLVGSEAERGVSGGQKKRVTSAWSSWRTPRCFSWTSPPLGSTLPPRCR